MKLDYIEDLIDRENINLIDTYLEDTTGAYINYDKINVILYDSTKLETTNEKKETLAEELGHYYTDSTYKFTSSKEFIDLFMKSQTAKFFDLPYDRTQWMGEENLLYDVLEENKNLPQGKLYDPESLFWIGYTYRYWHFLTNQESKVISQKCNAEMMHALYPAYHTLDCKQAVIRILEA